jgi:hypothetical protein
MDDEKPAPIPNLTTEEGADEAHLPPSASGRTWIFQANPKLFNMDEAISRLSEMTWSVSAHQELISPGDSVFLWKSGPEAGVIGEATVSAAPSVSEELGNENEFALDKEKFSGPQLRVRLRIHEVFEPPLSRDAMKADVRLAELSILKFAQGTNFVVTPDQAAVIRELLEMQRSGEDEIPGGGSAVAPGSGSQVWAYAPGPKPQSRRRRCRRAPPLPGSPDIPCRWEQTSLSPPSAGSRKHRRPLQSLHSPLWRPGPAGRSCVHPRLDQRCECARLRRRHGYRRQPSRRRRLSADYDAASWLHSIDWHDYTPVPAGSP